MKIAVGSTNPVKIEATKNIFSKFFDNLIINSFNVDSNVSAQPFGIETMQGAVNRARNLYKKFKDQYDFYVGIEGGIIELYNNFYSLGFCAILSKDNELHLGTSGWFELPNWFIKKLKEEKLELGDLIDNIANDKDSKKKYGAIGFLTRKKFNRKDLYEVAVIMALVPFLNKELYSKKA